MLRVGILGLGAIGHVVAAQLIARSDVQIHYFNRSPRSKLWINLFGGQKIEQAIDCLTQPFPVPLDWLIICLKANHYPAAHQWLTTLINPETKVIVIRNGLELTLPLLPYSTPKLLLPCLINAPTQRHSDGYYQPFSSAHFMLPEHALSNEAITLLKNDGNRITTHADFKTVSWTKLCASAALGAITCLSGQTSHIFENEDLIDLYRQLLNEGMRVAKAAGAQIPEGYEHQQLNQLKNYPPEKGSSMLNDRLAGKPVEVEAKNGVISQLGKKYDIATPLNDHFAALLSVINR